MISLSFLIPLAIIVYTFYLQWPLLSKRPISSATVALLLLMLIAFLLWRGGPSLVSRIQELGPLKLAPRVEHEVERLRPEIERALQEMDRFDEQFAVTLYLNPNLPADMARQVQRSLNRVGPLLTFLRLTGDPKTLADDLKASYCLLAYWEGRFLYHLGFYHEAIQKWESLWSVGLDFLARLGGPKFWLGDFCVYVGNAHVFAAGQETSPAVSTMSRRAAVAWYRRAIEYDPDLVEAFFNLAWVYDELDLPARAISSLDSLLVVNPAFVPAQYNRACAKSKLGMLEQAMEDLRRIPCPHQAWEVAQEEHDFENLRNSKYAAEFATRVNQCLPPKG